MKYVAFKSGTRQRNDITKVSSRPRKRLQLSNTIFKYSRQDLHEYNLDFNVNSWQFSNDCNHKRHESSWSKAKSGNKQIKIRNKAIETRNTRTSSKSHSA